MSGIPRAYRQDSLFSHLEDGMRKEYETSTALTVEDRILVPLLGTWEAYSPGATDFEAGLWARKNRFGMVTLEGLITRNAGVSSGNDIGTLPEGYRPLKIKIVSAIMYTVSGGPAIARIDIQPSGNIEWNAVYAGGTESGNVSFISFDNIHYYAEPI